MNKQNKLIKCSTALICGIILSSAVITPITSYASTNEMVSSSKNYTYSDKYLESLFNRADKYVSLDGGQYVLSDKANKIFNTNDIALVNKQLDETNDCLKDAYKTSNIDDTKIVSNVSDKSVTIEDNNSDSVGITTYSTKYHQGKNKIYMHWNYMTIDIKKSTLTDIKSGSLSLASFLLGNLKNVYVGAAAAIIMGVIGDRPVKGGMWFSIHHYAYISLEKWRYQ